MAVEKPRVLICDDDTDNYEKLKNYLESEEFSCDTRVETQLEVEQALKQAQEERRWYRIVMLDMDLGSSADPGLTGAQIYSNLLHDFPNETYIIYSSQDADKFRAEINRLMHRRVRFILLDSLLKEKSIRLHLAGLVSRTDSDRIFLVHGRNTKRKNSLVKLMKEGFGLKIIEWEDARERVTIHRDYIFEIVMKGIEMSHATVVLFTDDERVELKRTLMDTKEKRQREGRWQSRANVYVEAGYAMGVRPEQTIFVEWPMNQNVSLDMPSDFAGMHTIRLDRNAENRSVLKRRLEAARCAITPAKNWKKMVL